MKLPRGLIAVDGGGTKTEVVFASEKGAVLAVKKYGGTNLNSVGIENAIVILEQALMDMSEVAIKNKVKISGIYFGLAGGVNGNNQQIVYDYFKNKYFKQIPYSNGGDEVNAINVGVKNDPNGIAVIAGTGSNVMIKKDGQILPNPQLSGWGHFFDNGASGYDFGRDAVIAAKNEYNGTGKKTLITKMIEDKFGCSVFDALGRFYAADGVKAIASIAPLVFDAYHQGDEVAGEIIDNQVKVLADMINHAHEKIGLETPATVGLIGGIPEHHMEDMEDKLKKQIGSNLKISVPKESQIYGALMEAAKLAGVNADEKFLRTYHETINALQSGSSENGSQPQNQ